MQPLIKEEVPPAHQFINIQSQPVVNNASYAAASNGFNQKGPVTKVGFQISAETPQDTRQQNSRREFQIRRSSNSNSKRGGKKGPRKSPSEFTNVGAKSVVSMFTTQTGKTTMSAPPLQGLDSMESASARDSPLHAKQRDVITKKAKNVKKALVRPASSISPSKPLVKGDVQLAFS
jgi:hypothetical protein